METKKTAPVDSSDPLKPSNVVVPTPQQPQAKVFVPADRRLHAGLNRVTSMGRHGNQAILATGTHIFECSTKEMTGLSPTDVLVSEREILVSFKRENDQVRIAVKTGDDTTDPERSFTAKDFLLSEQTEGLSFDTPYPIVSIEWRTSEILLILRHQGRYLLHTIRNRGGRKTGIIDTLGSELMLATSAPQKYVFVVRTDESGCHHSPRIERKP